MRRYPLVLLLALLVVLLAAACSGGGLAGDPAPVAPAPTDGPTPIAVIPVEGRLQGGTPVRIEGRGFLDGEPVWVRVGDQILEGFASEDGVLEVDTPPGESPGPVNVGVVTRRGRTVLPDAYAYREPSPLLSLLPRVGFHDDVLGGTRSTLVVSHRPPQRHRQHLRVRATPGRMAEGPGDGTSSPDRLGRGSPGATR